jgi:hypothetical protein
MFLQCITLLCKTPVPRRIIVDDSGKRCTVCTDILQVWACRPFALGNYLSWFSGKLADAPVRYVIQDAFRSDLVLPLLYVSLRLTERVLLYYKLASLLAKS